MHFQSPVIIFQLEISTVTRSVNWLLLNAERPVVPGVVAVCTHLVRQLFPSTPPLVFQSVGRQYLLPVVC